MARHLVRRQAAPSRGKPMAIKGMYRQAAPSRGKPMAMKGMYRQAAPSRGKPMAMKGMYRKQMQEEVEESSADEEIDHEVEVAVEDDNSSVVVIDDDDDDAIEVDDDDVVDEDDVDEDDDVVDDDAVDGEEVVDDDDVVDDDAAIDDDGAVAPAAVDNNADDDGRSPRRAALEAVKRIYCKNRNLSPKVGDGGECSHRPNNPAPSPAEPIKRVDEIKNFLQREAEKIVEFDLHLECEDDVLSEAQTRAMKKSVQEHNMVVKQIINAARANERYMRAQLNFLHRH